MMTVHLQREIENLKKRILQISIRVEEEIQRAVESLQKNDIETAQKVIAADAVIDRMEVELEEDCLKVLALHQPVAADLRFVIAVLKINNDLERIADQAVNIAERSLGLMRFPRFRLPDELTAMLDKTRAMLRLSLQALIRVDADLARQVILQDDEVDDLNHTMYDLALQEIRRDPRQTERILQLLLAARHLERIADLVTNIAEDVIYLVEGTIVRHENRPKEDASETESDS